jgi:hypothetical protein
LAGALGVGGQVGVLREARQQRRGRRGHETVAERDPVQQGRHALVTDRRSCCVRASKSTVPSGVPQLKSSPLP